MHVKKGDNVVVLRGADKGKKGPVVRVLRGKNMVVIEGVNQKHKHQKPRRQGKKGQVVSIAHPIHASNVAHAAKAPKAKAKK